MKKLIYPLLYIAGVYAFFLLWRETLRGYDYWYFSQRRELRRMDR